MFRLSKSVKTVCAMALALILFTVGVSALGRGSGPERPGWGQGTPVVKEIFPLTGVVESVSLGIGEGSPYIVVQGETIVLGPYQVLEYEGFEVEEGDEVLANVFASLIHEGLLIAVEVQNLTRDQTLVLRDEKGYPVWVSARGRGSRNGRGSGDCLGLGPNLQETQQLSGTLVSVDAAPGQQHPLLVLDTGESVMAGPYRAWAEAEFEISVGDSLKIVAFPSTQQPGLWVAITVENLATGQVLVLRDDTGIPVSGKRWPVKRSRCSGSCSRGG